MKKTIFIGLDISKLTFDACLLPENGKEKHKVFDNTDAGHAKLLRWVETLVADASVHYCMEATGSYNLALAQFLTEQERFVSVVNPFSPHHAALTGGQGNKTDKADAKTIAHYAKAHTPPLWHMATPEVRLLTALLRRREVLEEQCQAEKNRLGTPGVLAPVVASLEKSLAFLKEEIRLLDHHIREHIEQSPRLRSDRDLLQSLPGIGTKTAEWLLGEMPDVHLFASAEALAAYAGLAPKQQQSGTSVKRPTRITRRGSARLRKALYFPAITALRYNPLVQALGERLRAKGLCAKQRIAAAMRKLLMLASGVLKHQQAFDPKWKSVGTATTAEA